jgi:hypothetical protein
MIKPSWTLVGGPALALSVVSACHDPVSLGAQPDGGYGRDGSVGCVTVADCRPSGGGSCATVCADGTNPCANACVGGQCVERGCPDGGDTDVALDALGRTCTRDDDCRSNPATPGVAMACGFPIAAGCAAMGVCVHFSGGGACSSAPACTCTGTTDPAPQCGLDNAYAREPIAHDGACADSADAQPVDSGGCTTVADCPPTGGGACATVCADGTNPCANACVGGQCVERGCPDGG